jgi:hypothetical protein
MEPTERYRPGAGTTLGVRLRARFNRHRLDADLAAGADPNLDPLRRARAQELVGEKTRRETAASIEQLLADASAPPRIALTSRVPISKPAVRDSRPGLEAIVERLKTPAYISPQGVAMIHLLLSDGNSPVYEDPHRGGDPLQAEELRGALEATVDAIDHGPVLVG